MEDIDLTKLSNQLEKIQDQVDDIALVADNAMKYLDYQLSQLENKEYAFAEKLVALGGKVNPIAANATASLSALNQLLANGIDSAEELEAAKGYADNLYSSLGDMDALWEEVGSTGTDAISYMNEELDSQMDRLNTLISILGHAKDIAGLLGATFLEDEDKTQEEIDATTVEVN
jgi:DNA-binding ferritin-like protein